MASSDRKDANGLAYLDAQEGMGRIGNNKALFSRLLDSFVRDTNWQKLCDALAADDIAAAAAAAHSIKGIGANLSMKALYAAAAALEQTLKAGNKDDALLEALRTSREETLDVVAQFNAELAYGLCCTLTRPPRPMGVEGAFLLFIRQ
jgi:HPt (histidine-containing phosphotransfer) domain-containing protein